MTPIEKKAQERAQANNPRKLPEKWIKAYLERRPEQLAEDVIQLYDENFKLRRQLRNSLIANATLTAIVTALAMQGLEALFQALR